MKNFIFLFLVIITASCSRSLIYSPSINPPNQALKEKEIDIQAGAGLLPETRPEEIHGDYTSTLGVGAQIGYGFSNKFNMSLKGWGDLEGRSNKFRSGYSLNARFYNDIDPNQRIIFIPKAGIALGGNEISGYALQASGVYQAGINNSTGWYGGVGFIWGFRDLDKELNYKDEMKMPMGFGISGNFGIGWEFTSNLRINCELNPIYQINTFDENSHFILSPTLGVAYTIN